MESIIGNLSMKDAFNLTPASWLEDYLHTGFSVVGTCVTIVRDNYTYTFEGDGIVCIKKDGCNPRKYDDHSAAYRMSKSVLEVMRDNYDKDEYRHELLMEYKEIREKLHESAERLYNFGGISHEELLRIKETFNLKWLSVQVHQKMEERG